MQEYLTTSEVAAYLRLKQRTVYDLVRQRRIPCARVSGKWLFPRRLIDQWVAEQTEHAGLTMLAPPAIIAGSHDPLLEWALREMGATLAMMTCGSAEGIRRMLDGEAAVAAAHLALTLEGAEGLLPDTAGALGGQLVVVEWARRQQGLIVAPGNPLDLRGLTDLLARRARLIRRQPGAGAEVLLLRLLARSGIDPGQLTWAPRLARTEFELAEMVADGVGDCGLAIRGAAGRLGLDFIALTQERFDLMMRQAAFFSGPVQRLLELTRTAAFSAEAARIAGYDIARAGRLVLTATLETKPVN